MARDTWGIGQLDASSPMTQTVTGTRGAGAGGRGVFSLVFLFVFVCVGVTPAVSESIYSQTGLILPGSFEAVDLTGKVPGNATGLNITVTGLICGAEVFASSDTTQCAQFINDTSSFEAGISLYCGGDESTLTGGASVSSEYVGGTQTVIIGNDGGLFTMEDLSLSEGGKLLCVVEALGYNGGPVSYTLNVEPVEGNLVLVDQQQLVMNNVYTLCCSNETGCSGWAKTEGVGRRRGLMSRSRALLQDAPGPAVDGPAQAPGVDVPVPDPAVDVPVPGPGPVVPDVPAAPAPAPQAGVFPEINNNFCQFSGSVCNDQGQLTTLDLSNMGLQCAITELADALSNVTTLQRLFLSGNPGLDGDLSVALGTFGGLTNATDILVSETGVSGNLGGSLDVPAAVCSLQSLKQLAFVDTDVSGSLDPCMFGNGTQLQVLLGSGSSVDSLPGAFGSSPMMRSLQMANASLSGTVQFAALPEYLGEFQVSNNTLDGSLPGPGNYMALYDVSNNTFNGTVVDGFVGHPTLRMVDLSRNQLTGLPNAWVSEGTQANNNGGAILPLQTLVLSNNPLNQTFPAGLVLYGNLSHLALSETKLSGDLPELGAGAFPALTHLWINQNNITGTVPDSWQNITLFTPDYTAERLGNFSYNQMGGNLPPWLAYYPPAGSSTTYDFAGNSFDNGCECSYESLNACAGACQPAPGPMPGPTPVPAPAPESPPPPDSKSSSDGSSIAFAVFVTLVSLVILGIGGYFVYKWWKGRQNQGSFQRYMDSGSSVVQMVSNQTYNPYNPSLAP